MINIGNLQSDQHILMKVYIFIGVFMLESIIALFSTLYKQCIVDVGKIIKDSLLSALVAVVAYSIYNDMISTSSIYDNTYLQNLIISITIIILIGLSYLIDYLLNKHLPKINDCLNMIYSGKSGTK